MRDGLGITVSYWRDRDSIARWKTDLEHREAQRLGRQKWYRSYRIRIAKVEEERSLSSRLSLSRKMEPRIYPRLEVQGIAEISGECVAS